MGGHERKGWGKKRVRDKVRNIERGNERKIYYKERLAAVTIAATTSVSR